MGKKIKVTPQDLDTASQKLADISEAYRGLYNQLVQVATTMGEAWDGEDNQAYVNQISTFSENYLKVMVERLSQASGTLKTQSQQYAARQDANTSMATKLTN
ncbi:WXG100 family type VII secretion target [Neobacillus sp. Marseille-QA0830]